MYFACAGAGGTTPSGGGVLNVTSDALYANMKTLLEEIVAVFSTSPYVHIGCDETGTPTSLPGYPAFAKEHNITGASDLFAYYVKTMADYVKALGKQAIVWGPASLTRLQPGASQQVTRLQRTMRIVVVFSVCTISRLAR